MTQFLVYDVFTGQRFGGNPLAIIPDASALPEDELQSIAREFNFSESTFVYPPANPAHSARVRIFTPTQEVPFAGHPTIGTAVALTALGHGPDLVLELGVGPITCSVDGAKASFVTRQPFEIMYEPDPALLARALGLDVKDLCFDTHTPKLASLGLPFTLVEVADRESLSKIDIQVAAFREGTERYPGSLDFAIMAYVRDGNTIHARMFAPLDNIPEDPATGSAAATLAALLAQIDGTALELTLHQGVDMGRPSVIELKVEDGAVTVSGKAVAVMRGEMIR